MREWAMGFMAGVAMCVGSVWAAVRLMGLV